MASHKWPSVRGPPSKGSPRRAERGNAAPPDLETFFADAPELNPRASLITGVICGHRVEEIDDPLMQSIRYMDKLVDELARGKKMATILRGGTAAGR